MGRTVGEWGGERADSLIMEAAAAASLSPLLNAADSCHHDLHDVITCCMRPWYGPPRAEGGYVQNLCGGPVLHGGTAKSETLRHVEKLQWTGFYSAEKTKNRKPNWSLQLSKMQLLKNSLHTSALFKDQRSRKPTTVAALQFKLGLAARH